jgi:hypothetical protein
MDPLPHLALVPWRAPLPSTLEVWVNRYWRDQKVRFTGVRVDELNQVHADYSFDSDVSGAHTGRLLTPPVLFGSEAGPSLSQWARPIPGLRRNETESLLENLLLELVEWTEPELDEAPVPWVSPLPTELELPVDPNNAELTAWFRQLRVEEGRILAEYEIPGLAITGHLVTPPVVYSDAEGPDFLTNPKLIDGLDETGTDSLLFGLLCGLVVWQSVFDAARALQRVVDAAPEGITVGWLHVWQEAQHYEVPGEPWWRAISYTDRVGQHKLAVDGPRLRTVGIYPADTVGIWPPRPFTAVARMDKPDHPIDAFNKDDRTMLQLLLAEIDPDQLHQQQLHADEL